MVLGNALQLRWSFVWDYKWLLVSGLVFNLLVITGTRVRSDCFGQLRMLWLSNLWNNFFGQRRSEVCDVPSKGEGLTLALYVLKFANIADLFELGLRCCAEWILVFSNSQFCTCNWQITVLLCLNLRTSIWASWDLVDVIVLMLCLASVSLDYLSLVVFAV